MELKCHFCGAGNSASRISRNSGVGENRQRHETTKGNDMTPEQLHAHSIALDAKILGLTVMLRSILKWTPEMKLNEKEIYQAIQSVKRQDMWCIPFWQTLSGKFQIRALPIFQSV
jgi:hypothetical protein